LVQNNQFYHSSLEGQGWGVNFKIFIEMGGKSYYDNPKDVDPMDSFEVFFIFVVEEGRKTGNY